MNLRSEGSNSASSSVSGRSWLAEREPRLRSTLGDTLILFGEWCALRHSVRYDRLPDWLLAFDVYDASADAFWSRDRRDALCEELGIATVPLIAEGRFTLDQVGEMLTWSRLGAPPMEGLVVRRDEQGFRSGCAKLVREDFLQHDEAHWRSRPFEFNAVA